MEVGLIIVVVLTVGVAAIAWASLRFAVMRRARRQPDSVSHVSPVDDRGTGAGQRDGDALRVPKITPFTAALIPVERFITNQVPFAEENPGAVAGTGLVLGEYEEYVASLELAYKFVTFLKLIQAKFGAEVAQIVQAHLGVALQRMAQLGGEGSEQPRLLFVLIRDLNQATDSAMHTHQGLVSKGVAVPVGEKNLPFSDVPLEYVVAQLALQTLPQSPLVRQRGVPKDLRELDGRNVGGDVELGAMMRLAGARDQAVAAFSPLVDLIVFEPLSVQGLR